MPPGPSCSPPRNRDAEPSRASRPPSIRNCAYQATVDAHRVQDEVHDLGRDPRPSGGVRVRDRPPLGPRLPVRSTRSGPWYRSRRPCRSRCSSNRARAARVPQSLPLGSHRRGCSGPRSSPRDTPNALRNVRVRTGGVVELVARPDIEPPFVSLAVGVERRIETTVWSLHLAHDPVEVVFRPRRFTSSSSCACHSRRAERAQAARCRRASSRSAARAMRVDGVTVKPTTHLVVDAAACHASNVLVTMCSASSLPVVRNDAQQEVERHRWRELRRAPEPAVTRRRTACASVGVVRRSSSSVVVGPLRRLHRDSSRDVLGELLRRLSCNVVPAVQPRVRDRSSTAWKRGMPCAIFRREIRPGEERHRRQA